MNGEVIKEVEKEKVGGFAIKETCDHCLCQFKIENEGKNFVPYKGCCKCGHREVV